MNATWLALTAAAAFGITAALGFWLIPLLHKLKFGQTIREVGPKWHKNKQGTPTMGGVMFILGIVIAALLCLPLCYAQLGWETPLMLSKVFGGLLMAVGFGAIGFMDDFISIRKKRNLGLTEKQKLALQFLVAGAYLLSLRLAGDDTATTIPFFGSVDLGLIYYPLAAILIVGLTNAVNFTDGIDGLCASVSMFVFAALGISAALMNMAGLTLLSAAAAAACLGFLLWNLHPAKVFMGDTGSLFLGGAVCGLAFALNLPLVIPIIGFVYVAETLSDIIQVVYFKKTGGKRFFRMAPLHHHFEMGGWSETKLFCVFSGVTLLLCALAFLGVMNRYPV